jgi:hypothetical protein
MNIPTPHWLKSFEENLFSLVPTISWNKVWQNLQFRLDDFINSIKHISIKHMVRFRAQFPTFINFDVQIFQKNSKAKLLVSNLDPISHISTKWFLHFVGQVSMLCNHLKLTTRIRNKTYLILIAFRDHLHPHIVLIIPQSNW